MRLHCSKCGKSVSTEIPDGTIVRAWLECPECLVDEPEHKALQAIANIEMPPAESTEAIMWQTRLYDVRSIARDAIGMKD